MVLKNRIQKSMDMTSGNIYRLLIAFAIPLLLGDLFQQLYNMADTWVIGNFATNDEYAAVGACTHIQNVIIKTFIGLSSGAGIIIARDFGNGDYDKVKRGASTAFIISLVCSVVFTIAGICFVPLALRLTDVPEAVYDYAKTYLNIIFYWVSAQIIYNMGAAILRAVGDSKKPFIYLMIAAIVNVVLDLVFVIKFHMGIAGVAWATAIAQVVAAILVVIELFSTKLPVKIEKNCFVNDKAIRSEMISLGIPTALQMAITAVSNVFIQSYINGLGVDFMGGFSTFNKMEQILFMSSNSLGVACMTFVSQNLGAGNAKRAKDGFKASSIINEAYSIFIGGIIMIFAPQIAAFFNDTPEVVSYGVLALRLVTPLYVFQAMSHMFMGAMRGAGNTKLPLYFQVIFNICFRQVSMYVLCNYISYTPVAVLATLPMAWVVLFIALLIGFRRINFEERAALKNQ